MKILHTARELPPDVRKACGAIGFFDGVHLGHQQIIRQTVTDARRHEAASVVITFDRHPTTIVAPERVPPLIYSLPQKLRVIESLGVDYLLLISFDRSFSEQSGEKFIRGLARDFRHLHSLCVGSHFTFGHQRSGDVELLRRLGAELNFTVHGLAAVALDGLIVSSTRIRDSIRRGNLEPASQMLGRAYSLAGLVRAGDQVGRKILFPTANIETTGLALPPTGVYAVHAEVGGQTCRAVVNLGFRPTVASAQPKLLVEAHLLDFSGDLYGQEMEITFVEKLRDEQKFPNLTALRDQIHRDIEKARAVFES
jgi:riboflavin kinase / FMN adenylyltransferase